MANVRKELYEDIAASGVTSNIYFAGDAWTVSLFLRGSPSTTTIQLSNATGFRSEIDENAWSNATTVISPEPDMLDIQAGFRWIRCLRSETTEVTLNLVQRK